MVASMQTISMTTAEKRVDRVLRRPRAKGTAHFRGAPCVEVSRQWSSRATRASAGTSPAATAKDRSTGTRARRRLAGMRPRILAIAERLSFITLSTRADRQG